MRSPGRPVVATTQTVKKHHQGGIGKTLCSSLLPLGCPCCPSGGASLGLGTLGPKGQRPTCSMSGCRGL